jgi:ORF6N domain
MYMAIEPAISSEEMAPMVHFIRGKRVMLDYDLARIYGVETKRLKEQFNRNRDRFPENFAFVLKRKEFTNLRSQFATSSLHGGLRYLPMAFTEHGTVMLASLLNSKRAVEMSIFVVEASIRMREILVGNKQLAQKLSELESRVSTHDESIATMFEAIRELLEPATPKTEREIGFHIKEKPMRYRTRNGN